MAMLVYQRVMIVFFKAWVCGEGSMFFWPNTSKQYFSETKCCFTLLWYRFRNMIHAEVSKNRGTPKSSILIGRSGIFHYKRSIWGYPHLRKPPCFICGSFWYNVPTGLAESRPHRICTSDLARTLGCWMLWVENMGEGWLRLRFSWS